MSTSLFSAVAQAAPLFATGMVNGYFDNDVPVEFWELLALYISSNTLSSLPWAVPFGDEQMQIMVNQANDVLSWYDNMKNSVPTWYKGVIPASNEENSHACMGI